MASDRNSRVKIDIDLIISQFYIVKVQNRRPQKKIISNFTAGTKSVTACSDLLTQS